MSNASCNVHGVDETQSFLHPALADELFDGVGDVEVIAPMRRFEPEVFREAFHAAILRYAQPRQKHKVPYSSLRRGQATVSDGASRILAPWVNLLRPAGLTNRELVLVHESFEFLRCRRVRVFLLVLDCPLLLGTIDLPEVLDAGVRLRELPRLDEIGNLDRQQNRKDQHRQHSSEVVSDEARDGQAFAGQRATRTLDSRVSNVSANDCGYRRKNVEAHQAEKAQHQAPDGQPTGLRLSRRWKRKCFVQGVG